MAEVSRTETSRVSGSEKPSHVPLKEGSGGASQLLERKDVVAGEPPERIHTVRPEPQIDLKKAKVTAQAIQEKCSYYVDSLRALEAGGRGTAETKLKVEVLTRVATVSLEKGKVNEDVLADLVTAGMFLEEELKKDLETQEGTIRKQDPLAQLELELKAIEAKPAQIEQETRAKLIEFLEKNNFLGRDPLLNKIRDRFTSGEGPMSAREILVEATFDPVVASAIKGEWDEIGRDFAGRVWQSQREGIELQAKIDRLKVARPAEETARIAEQERKYNAARQEAEEARKTAEELKQGARKLKTEAEEAEGELEAHKSLDLKKAEGVAKTAEQAYQAAVKNRNEVKSKLDKAEERTNLLTDDYIGELQQRLDRLKQELSPIIQGHTARVRIFEEALQTASGQRKENIGRNKATTLEWVAHHQKRILEATELLQKAKEDKANLPEEIKDLNAEIQVADARREATSRTKNKARKAVKGAKTEEDKELEKRAKNLRDEADVAEGKAAVAEGKAKDKEGERDQAQTELNKHKNWQKEREAAQAQIEGLRKRIDDIREQTDLLIEVLVESKSLLDKRACALLMKEARGEKLGNVERVRLWWEQIRGALAKAKSEEAAKREMRALLEELRERPLSTLMASYNLARAREEITEASGKGEERMIKAEEIPRKVLDQVRESAGEAVEKFSALSQEKQDDFKAKYKAKLEGAKDNPEEQERILKEMVGELGVDMEKLKAAFEGEGRLKKTILELLILILGTLVGVGAAVIGGGGERQ